MKNLKKAFFVIMWVFFIFLSGLCFSTVMYGIEKDLEGTAFFGFAGFIFSVGAFIIRQKKL